MGRIGAKTPSPTVLEVDVEASKACRLRTSLVVGDLGPGSLTCVVLRLSWPLDQGLDCTSIAWDVVILFCGVLFSTVPPLRACAWRHFFLCLERLEGQE